MLVMAMRVLRAARGESGARSFGSVVEPVRQKKDSTEMIKKDHGPVWTGGSAFCVELDGKCEAYHAIQTTGIDRNT